jgi:hypothetical protein
MLAIGAHMTVGAGAGEAEEGEAGVWAKIVIGHKAAEIKREMRER